MGLPFSGELTGFPSCCDQQGTDPTNTGVQYVVSLNDLQGIVTLAGTGAIELSSVSNVITIGLSASAGLGSVTSVALASSNSNLVVVSGSPILTNGTITLDLAGNLDSISGLVMAADQMLYSTGAATFAATSLTSFARTFLDDANAAAVQTTLGLVIGTNVQAFSQDLSDFVTNVSWSGDDMTSSGGLTLGDALNVSGTGTFTGLVSGAAGASFSGNVDSGTFTGDGSGLTNLQAGDISSGTLAVARGGTGLASYTTGQVLYASGAATLAGLTAGAAGTFLRFAGAGVAPVVSTLILPNAATTGDIFMATGANTMGRLANVAVNNVLLSGGVGVVSAFGKVTLAHTTGIAASGINSDITEFVQAINFTDVTTFSEEISVGAELNDASASPGSTGDLLTSTGSGTDWSNQIAVSTLRIDTSLSLEGTITAGGVTGNQTINKLMGSVNIAAGGSSITVTNSLVADGNTCVFCQIATNDTTAIIKNVVASTGQFVIRTTANVTAETRINFLVVLPS
jgi:hypothetical protein